jgi:cell fate regulator YaaT (PSP1 superfamily)
MMDSAEQTAAADDLVGVRFKEAGRVYYFTPGGLDLEVGEYVVVETTRGLELGTVVIAPGQVLVNELEEELKPVLRYATDEDVQQNQHWRAQERQATIVGREAAASAGLPMRVVSSDYNLDGSRLTVFFESEERVDFRDLIRDLGRQLNTRVEMRQIGPRDRSKLVDGYGRCGERLCCSSWLTSFPTISIKMAKDQGLPLNPSKISGVCGRLLCCLIYEHDMYKHIRGTLPKLGARVTTPFGEARVVKIDTLKEMLTFQLEDMSTVVLPAADVNYGTVVRPADEEPVLPRYIGIAEKLEGSDNLLSVVNTPEQDEAYGEDGESYSAVAAEDPLAELGAEDYVGGGAEEPSSEEETAIGLVEAAIEGDPAAELGEQSIEAAEEAMEEVSASADADTEPESAGTSEHSRRRRNRRRRGGRNRNRQ